LKQDQASTIKESTEDNCSDIEEDDENEEDQETNPGDDSKSVAMDRISKATGAEERLSALEEELKEEKKKREQLEKFIEKLKTKGEI